MELIWHNLSVEEVLRELKTTESGLPLEEVKKRQEKYGLNKLPQAKRLTAIFIFLNQFRNPLIIILLLAAAITLALREFIDFSVIIAAIFLNTLIGYWQEAKAEKALEQLKKMIEYKAKVIRDGREHLISFKELVPGDILILEAGDIVLADARLIAVHNLQVIEAVLTGESMPSTKKTEVLDKGTILADRENMVYLGSNVVRGKGRAVVVATGEQTEFGKIAKMISAIKEEKTPLQKKMEALVKVISFIIIILVSILFLIGLISGRSFLEMLLTSVAVSVAAIPEGLVIAVTVCLAIGMQRILKKKALVRKLVAAETLGSTTVICTDKTGTLTEGKMVLSHIVTFDKTDQQPSRNLVLKIGLLCSSVIIENPDDELHQWIMNGDETEKALILAGVQSGLDLKRVQEEFPKIDEIPFDPEKMLMATLHKSKNRNIILVKGAPEKLIKMSKYIEIDGEQKDLDAKKRKEIESECLKLTGKGLRVLALAYKTTSDAQNFAFNSDLLYDLVFVGLAALKDPLRPEVRETIKECKQASLRPIILTGDHRLTAEIIAEEAGLIVKDHQVLEGKDLDKMDDQELAQQIKKINVFARVEPKHKIRIVDILQSQGEVVAMTGDGVNDAPALKSADIGIALGSGTEVTKETADIVLLDDNFKTIVEAIKEGRGIFDNIKKIVLYLMTSSFAEIILVSGSLLLGLPIPILPAQILWVNILEDGLPAMALTYEKASKEVMKEKPRGLKVPILDKEMNFLIFVIGIVTSLILFVLFLYLWQKTHDIYYARTMVFVGLGIDALFYVFSCKNLKKNIFQYNPFDNKFLNLSIVFSWLMFFSAIYLPFFQKILRTVSLGISDWLILIGFGLINLILIEFGKWLFIKKR